MKNPEQSIKVFAINNDRVENKFDIYLEHSGHWEWLMMHKRNGALFNLLKDGITLGSLRRLSRQGNKQHKSHFSQYLVRVIDEFIAEEGI